MSCSGCVLCLVALVCLLLLFASAARTAWPTMKVCQSQFDHNRMSVADGHDLGPREGGGGMGGASVCEIQVFREHRPLYRSG